MDIINAEDKETSELLRLLNMIIKLIMHCFWVRRNRRFVRFRCISISVFLYLREIKTQKWIF